MVIEDHPSLDISGDLSLEAWIKTEQNNPVWRHILYKGGTCSLNERPYLLDIYNGKLCFSYKDCSCLHSNTQVSDGRWHHVIAVHNNTKDTIYIDGRLDSERNSLGNLPTTDYQVTLGDNFIGSLDEVRIHRRALNESEILDSYSSYQGSSLAALYYLDEGEGSVALDYSGNGNNGSIHGASWGEGFSESGLFFDGVDDYVEVSDSHTLDFLDAVTVEAWVNPNQSQNQWPMIFHKGVSGERILLRLDQSTLKASFIIWVNGIGKSLSSNTPLPAGRWSHLAASFNKSSGEWKIYVNGELDNSMNSSWGLPNTRGANAFIGYAGFGDSFFVGGLDEIKLYHTVLVPERLKEKYDLYRDVLIYHFDEGYGRMVSDSSLHEHTGLVKGANWTEGISGYGLSFE
ncbi:MAG: hypothetical protein B6U72_07655 [Candidatus Altiarchaeales archaeon ex4484_2]|nr:MAG: hypothetical protein B6U72_07655 [Candidatus Altiarchaeales archaeon ex4484_2]